uniref:Uncharacterized protein n=1 Tax=Octopus bimaculoides TaxID=37653 RepID=A0A0L8I080_OCTBM
MKVGSCACVHACMCDIVICDLRRVEYSCRIDRKLEIVETITLCCRSVQL